MNPRRLLAAGFASAALMGMAAGPPVAGSAKKKPIFFKIKSNVSIESRGFPTPLTYSFEGGTSAGGAGFQLSRCRFGRTVRLHYVNAAGDVVVGSATSVRPPEGGLEGLWQITAPRPGVPTEVYAQTPKRKVRQGVCKPDTSPRITLPG